RTFGSGDHEHEAPKAELPVPKARAARRLVLDARGELERGVERACPDAEKKGDLHAAEERPVERTDAKERRGREIFAPGRERREEAPRGDEKPKGRQARNDARPHHEERATKPRPVTRSENERVEEAGVAARIAVPDGPLEWVAAGRGARVVEV